MPTIDYDTMRLRELAAIGEFLRDLDADQWDQSSLCEGWRVRDVIAHMCVGYTTPLIKMTMMLGRRRFDVAKASFEESRSFGSRHSPSELRATLDSVQKGNVRRGISRFIKPSEGLVDHLIHHQDIRRPLGRPRAMPEERLAAALDVVPTLGGFVGAKSRVEGLRLVATDVDWSHGEGPEVEGTGEAILLVASGRPDPTDEMSGRGAAILRERVAA